MHYRLAGTEPVKIESGHRGANSQAKRASRDRTDRPAGTEPAKEMSDRDLTGKEASRDAADKPAGTEPAKVMNRDRTGSRDLTDKEIDRDLRRCA